MHQKCGIYDFSWERLPTDIGAVISGLYKYIQLCSVCVIIQKDLDDPCPTLVFIIQFLFDFCVRCVIIPSMSSSSSVLYFSSLHMYYELLLTASSFPSEEHPSVGSYTVRGERVPASLSARDYLLSRNEWCTDDGPAQPGPIRIWPRSPRLKFSDCGERAAFPFLPHLEW